MSNYFIPYSGKKPAATQINGHRLLILAQDKSVFEENLMLLGADRLKRVRGGSSKEEEQVILAKLARTAQAGLVIAPSEIGVEDVIKNLEAELPWIQ